MPAPSRDRNIGLRQVLNPQLHFVLRATATAAAVATAAACEGLNPTPGPTMFAGVIAGAHESGSLTFEQGATLTATLRVVSPAGSTHALSAAFDPATGELGAAGDGYQLSGTATTTGVILGSYFGPNGSGAFSLQTPAPKASVRSFCGTYTVAGGTGVLDLILYLSGITGVAVSASGQLTFPTGSLTSTSVTVDNPDHPSVPLATGTLSGAGLSGVYDDGNGNQGTWRAALC
jgi:hypothetical protein